MPRKPRNLELRKGVYWFRKRINGRQFRECLHTTVKREAQRLARDLEQEKRRNPLPKGQEYTVSSFGKRWLKEWVGQKRNEKGQKLAATRLRSHIKPVLGSLKLKNVKQGEMRHMIGVLGQKGLGPETVKHVLSDLRCLLRYAVEVEAIPSAPSFRSLMPSIPERAPNRLTDRQVERILAVLPPQHEFTVRLALLTGMRYGELHKLQWKHVRWEPEPHLILENTKSKKVRRVPLPTEAVELLQEAYRKKRLFYVLESRAKSAGNIYKRSAEKCGFKWHFHQLRHTFACRYLEAGGSPAALKEILGHSTIKLTERYSKLSDEAVFSEARKVDLRAQSGHQSGHQERVEETQVVKL